VGYGIVADLIVAVHVAFVAYVVLGQLVILAGMLARWSWVRNLWFRCSHLLAIGIVALETVVGVSCPLTLWEQNLRSAAGQPVSEATFIGRMMHYILFYNLPTWVFSTAYLSFFGLVVLTFVLAPPRRRPRKPKSVESESMMPAESV
jgi:uncharacterized protein DUF2784